MTKPITKSSIDDEGLRYKAKVSGSPFKSESLAGGPATMSCFLCGRHRPRSMMAIRKYIGKAQSVCQPSCKELDAILADKAK
jgi:hypothetical protein